MIGKLIATPISRRQMLQTSGFTTANATPVGRVLTATGMIKASPNPIKFTTHHGISTYMWFLVTCSIRRPRETNKAVTTNRISPPNESSPEEDAAILAAPVEAACRATEAVWQDVNDALPPWIRNGEHVRKYTFEYFVEIAKNKLKPKNSEDKVTQAAAQLSSIAPHLIAKQIAAKVRLSVVKDKEDQRIIEEVEEYFQTLDQESANEKLKQVINNRTLLASLYYQALDRMQHADISGLTLNGIFDNGEIDVPDFAKDWLIQDLKQLIISFEQDL